MLRRCNPLLRATPTCATLRRRDPSRRKPDVACLGRNPLLALRRELSVIPDDFEDLGLRTSSRERLSGSTMLTALSPSKGRTISDFTRD